MATIYSQQLGVISVADAGIVHNLYTVPVSGGPAVVRSASLAMQPGAEVFLFVVDLVPENLILAHHAFGGAGSWDGEVFTLYQPVPPGWSLQAANLGGSTGWSVILGGYQFAQP